MVFDLFRRGPQKTTLSEPGAAARVARRSSGLAEFSKSIAGRDGLTILDLGPTSPQNIRAITEMGHKVYNEDVLLSSLLPEYALRNEDGSPALNIDAFLMQNLKYQPQQFDAVLCWDVPDYLPEELVKPIVERLALAMKPGGVLLGFFHTKDAGSDAAYYRYHIAGADMLDLQTGPRFRLQRIFNNRHIENLFREFGNIKFFLARDNVREVLVTR
jgi:2-polyprenyl-3-methyl-5-hydroxy-6-metoxy-1,4-benzoquinol methylase